jgi:hypothetical protein
VAVWSDEGEGIWSGFDRELCKRTREARGWATPFAMTEALRRENPGLRHLTRNGIAAIEERGRCRRATFVAYCQGLGVHPSAFDIVEPRPVIVSALELFFPRGIAFRPVQVPIDGSPEAHSDSPFQIIICGLKFRNKSNQIVSIEGLEFRLIGNQAPSMEGFQIHFGSTHWADLSDRANQVEQHHLDALHIDHAHAMWAAMAPSRVGGNSVNFREFNLPPNAFVDQDMVFRDVSNSPPRWVEFLRFLEEFDGNNQSAEKVFFSLRIKHRAGGQSQIPITITLPVDRGCVARNVQFRMRQYPNNPTTGYFVQFRVSHRDGEFCGAYGPNCYRVAGATPCRKAGR